MYFTIHLCRFLTTYGARQAKHQHGQTVHTKHLFVRACLATRKDLPTSDTLGWPSHAAQVS